MILTVTYHSSEIMGNNVVKILTVFIHRFEPQPYNDAKVLIWVPKFSLRIDFTREGTIRTFDVQRNSTFIMRLHAARLFGRY